MQIKLRRASLAGPSDRSSAATRLIANIFQGTDLVRRHCDSPLERPTSRPGDSARLPSPTRFGPHPRSSRHSIHIGHALGSGFVQSIFSPASRRRPFECFPSASRRDADLKILCNIPLTEYRLDVVSTRRMMIHRSGNPFIQSQHRRTMRLNSCLSR
jgi:hypothetical protein